MLKTHTHAQLIAIQFSKAEMTADVELLRDLLDDECIFLSYMGAVHGKAAVLSAFADAKRNQFNKRQFGKFVQVQHCLDSDLTLFSECSVPSANEDFEMGTPSFLGSSLHHAESESGLRGPFDRNGFDSQGFAQFERDGEFSIDIRGSIRKVDLKETIVVRSNGLIVLLSRTRRP